MGEIQVSEIIVAKWKDGPDSVEVEITDDELAISVRASQGQADPMRHERLVLSRESAANLAEFLGAKLLGALPDSFQSGPADDVDNEATAGGDAKRSEPSGRVHVQLDGTEVALPDGMKAGGGDFSPLGIYACRKMRRLGLSIKTLARAAGLAPSTVGRFLRGGHDKLAERTLINICNTLNISKEKREALLEESKG